MWYDISPDILTTNQPRFQFKVQHGSKQHIMVKTQVILPFLGGLTWAIPATWPMMGTSWHQSHCHACEAAARHDRGLPPCWPLAPAAGPRARRRWLSGCLQPHCGSGMLSPARWYSAGRHLKERGRRRRCCSLWCNVFRLAELGPVIVISEGALTSLDSSVPGQAAMRLDAGHKDW